MRTTLSLFSQFPQQQQQQQESNESYYHPANTEQVIKPKNKLEIGNITSKSAHLLVFPQATSFPFLRINKQKTEEYQRVSEKAIPSPLATPYEKTNPFVPPKKNEQLLSQLDNHLQNNNVQQQEQPTSLEELPDVITALSEDNTDNDENALHRLKLIPTEKWRDNSLSQQAKKLFEIGNGGIVLPKLSYKNAKLRDTTQQCQQQQQQLDTKIMNSMLNLRSLSEENRKYIKKQLLPIKFEGEHKTPCESVLDFFTQVTKMNEQKRLRLKLKQQKQQEEEAEERANAYQMISQQSPSKSNKSGMFSRYKEMDSPLKSIDSRRRFQELKNNEQINDINNDGNEEDNNTNSNNNLEGNGRNINNITDQDILEEQGEIIKAHKMNVNFSTRRRAIDPGPVEYLMTSSKETYVQPGFMQERGSMCITELWPESMKLELVRSHYHNNKKHQQQQLRKIIPLLAHQNNNNTNNIQNKNKSYFLRSSIKVQQDQQKLNNHYESPRKLTAYLESDELFHKDVKVDGLPKISTSLTRKKQQLSPVDSETQINNTYNSRQYFRNRAITEMSESNNEISQELKDEQKHQRLTISNHQNNQVKNNLASSAALASSLVSSSPSLYYQTTNKTNNTTAITATQHSKIIPRQVNESNITISATTIASDKIDQIKSDCEYALSVNQALEESITSDILAVNNRLDRILLKIK